jgi:putative hydrolase of the HAD superfamily
MDLDDYRAVVFDLFHTLTSADAVRLPGKGTSEILGVSRQDWNKQLLDHSDDRLRGKITDPFLIIERMAHAIDSAIPVVIIEEAVRNRIERFRHALTSIEASTLNTLSELRKCGKLLGLVSNADVNEIAGWQDSPLKPYFNSVVFSCRAGYIKPEKEIYEIALKELEVLPGDAVYIGDGGSDELQGAKRIGMTTVLTTHVIKQLWPERIAKAKQFADYTIGEIAELIV